MADTTTSHKEKPAHHGDGVFFNPWPSARPERPWPFIRSRLPGGDWSDAATNSVARGEKPDVIPIKWEEVNAKAPKEGDHSLLQTTWLGHACFLVQLNGRNILFDPVFSDRCSPSQIIGPKRYTPPPCSLADLPEIDIVIISHNHYDHMDQTTLEFLGRSKKTKFFVPLGNKAWFGSLGIERCVEMDWWDGVSLGELGIKITCTPCQHFSGRGLFDRFKSLWSSWVVESVASDGETKARVYFAGDTGYRAVDKNPREYDEEYLDTLPHCPAFKEIGTRKGPFDLALIPIGAFSPRHLMSPVHCSPEDAVRVHEDVQSKRSIGMHWGTWVLTDEDVSEPPRRLKAAMENRRHDPK